MEKAEVIHKDKNKPCEARLIFILDVEKFVEKVWWKYIDPQQTAQ